MKNNDFLINYQFLQYGIMFNKLIDLGFASIVWSKTYDSVYFNHALVDRAIIDKELSEIVSEMNALKRSPAVYFVDSSEKKSLKELLVKKGFEKNWEDSWMFYDEKLPEVKLFKNILKVKTARELDVFLNTFDDCYHEDDPQNPYGKLGKYLDVAKESWERYNESGKLEYFMLYDNDKPVAVSSLTNFSGIGYISNVGSLKNVRGKGFGKAISLYAVKKSMENNNKHHVLATEDGHYPNEFYKRTGFKTKFTAVGYVIKVKDL